MLIEKDLAKPTKEGINTLEKARILFLYLYSGKEIQYDGYTYKMDGDFNPYIVGKREGGNVPLFQNDTFWNTLIEMADSISDEAFGIIKLEVASIKVLTESER